MNIKEMYDSRLTIIEKVASSIKPGDRILVPMLASVPRFLLDGLCEYAQDLSDITVIGNSYIQDYKMMSPEYNGKINILTMFYMPWDRKAIERGRKYDKEIVQLSSYYREKIIRNNANVAFVAVTPPDENGNMSLGPAPSDVPELIASVDKVIAQVNPRVPFVHGESCMINVRDVDMIVEHDEALAEVLSGEPTEKDVKIASYIAERVSDGACLQLGIGGVPAAVGRFLKDKKDLGIHTEMMGDTMIDLIECGAVNNSKKTLNPGVSIFGACMGTKRLYDYIDDNKLIQRRAFHWVNNPYVIGQNDNVVSINGAVALDTTGQCCAENIGFRQYSGTGGHLDFARGAQLSRGGQSFIALHAATVKKDGTKISKITTTLPIGSPVTTPRTDVQFVATEYGIADIQYQTVENVI